MEDSPQLFLVGATGHLGCMVLAKFINVFPNVTIRALVRSQSNADSISKLYPQAEIVIGGLEDVNLMESEASKANIVVNCAPDVPFPNGIKSLLRGLESREIPGYYIHTSGAASMWGEPNGDIEGDVWDDIRDIGRIRSLPDTTVHAITDKIASTANSKFVNTAVVSPPFIVGLSPSPIHPTPLTFPDVFHIIKSVRAGFIVGKGANRVCFVEVDALAQLFLHLAKDALHRLGVPGVETNARPGDDTISAWGPDAYYYLSTVELAFEQFMAQHLLPAIEKASPEVLAPPTVIKTLSVDEITEMVKDRLGGILEAELWSRHIAEGMGTAMRVRGSRAERIFGVKPTGAIGLDECVSMFLGKNT